MSQIFINVINMSIAASFIVLLVLLLRLLLKKAPKWITLVFWCIVAIRLICPFSIESVFSLVPSVETITKVPNSPRPNFDSGITILDNQINDYLHGNYFEGVTRPNGYFSDVTGALAIVWFIGIVTLLIYLMISYLRIKNNLRTAVLFRDNIYQSENAVSPFVFGLIKPKIYIPFDINDKIISHVIAHENAHIRRKDQLWKLLGFLLLTLHWFNPLIWVSYILFCRDIEFACDEKVIKNLDRDARADYSEAILSCSVSRRLISTSPLAFCEVGVKDRVKSVLKYKKPEFWIIIAAIVACVVAAVCFLTNPPTNNKNNFLNTSELIFTDYEGVYVTINSIDTNSGGHTVFNLMWHNNTNEKITYGEFYSIERKEGNKWVNTISEELYFNSIGLILLPNSTENKYYSTQNFDLSSSGTYRLRVVFHVDEDVGHKEYNTWIEFKVGSIPTTEFLREKHPEYFGLDASDGLDVYVWQMAKNHYSFGLLPHAEQGRDLIDHELLNLTGTSAEEMSVILSTYNVDDDEIYIIPWQNPLSSYLGEWQIIEEGEAADDLNAKKTAYVEQIRHMLSSVIVPVEFKTVFDTSTFDIDNDGVDEVCTMSFGPTSGLFTFTFNAREIGTEKLEYHTVIYSQLYDLSFQKGSDGITRVQGITQGENPKIHLFDISINDGNVYLFENGVNIGEIID